MRAVLGQTVLGQTVLARAVLKRRCKCGAPDAKRCILGNGSTYETVPSAGRHPLWGKPANLVQYRGAQLRRGLTGRDTCPGISPPRGDADLSEPPPRGFLHRR